MNQPASTSPLLDHRLRVIGEERAQLFVAHRMIEASAHAVRSTDQSIAESLKAIERAAGYRSMFNDESPRDPHAE